MKTLNEYINESSINIDKYMFHLANPVFRDSILEKGLIPQKGASTEIHWDDMGVDLPKCVFMFKGNEEPYDSTYDDDLWVIDTTNLDKSKFKKDIDDYMYKKYGSVMYTDIVDPSYITLEYKGSDGKDTTRKFMSVWKKTIKKYK